MALNWAIAVWSLFAAAGIWFLMFLFGLIAYKKQKYSHLLVLVLSLLFSVFTNLVRAFAVLFESPTLGIIADSLMIPSSVVVLCFLDLIMSDTIRPRTILFVTIITTLILRAFFDPNVITFMPIPDGTKYLLEDWGLAIPVVLLMFGVVARGAMLSFQMLKKSPKTLKIYPRIFLIGMFLVAPIAGILFIIGLTDLIYTGGIWVISALGVMIIFLAFAKEPKLAFILPFTIYKLAVMDTNSGILIYSHNFDRREQKVDDVLFSGMIQGINLILNEAMNKGALEELKLAKALILIERDPKYPVACLLVTTHISALLRKSLNTFFRRFITKFGESLGNVVDTAKFAKADDFVSLFFGFIPEYD